MRNAYAEQVGFVADLAYKTRRLVEEGASQEGLGRLTKTVTFDVKTLEGLRSGTRLRRRQGLQPGAQACTRNSKRSRPPRRCCDRSPSGPNAFSRSLENRNTTGLAAMDYLAALAKEKEEAVKARQDSGLSTRAFGVYWSLKDDEALAKAGISGRRTGEGVRNTAHAFPERAGQRRRAAAPPRRALSSAAWRSTSRTEDGLSRRCWPFFSTADLMMRSRDNGRAQLLQSGSILVTAFEGRGPDHPRAADDAEMGFLLDDRNDHAGGGSLRTRARVPGLRHRS